VSERRAELAGRVIIVTGGAGGIGRACAVAARNAGARVVVADLDRDRAQAAAAAIDPDLEHALGVAADVTRAEDCAAMVEAATARFGGLDGAVLAAGVAQHVPVLELTRQQWDAMLAVHLTGTFLCVQALAARMAPAGGALVYVASTVTLGIGPLHHAHYVAAKSGALGFVRAAARELGTRAIRLNAVSPGFTVTSLNDGLFRDEDIEERIRATPLGRVAEPADVAGVATFLLSDASSFVTGQTILVNGGAQMW
jgi:3-oxoacyl-[acyl-carrier protein] reductase